MIDEETKKDLELIYKYFGGRANKLQKLYEEAGEYRDRYILNGQTSIFDDKILTEIADIASVILQLYFNEPQVREKLLYVIGKTKIKIQAGYYEN